MIGASASDNTSEHSQHAKLQEAYHQLAEKDLSLKRMNRELQAVGYVLSHDLQEPLRKIRNFLSLALGKEELEPESRKCLEKSYESAWGMQELLEDLLVYLKIKDADNKFEVSDLGELLGSVIKEYEARIAEQKVKVDYADLGEAEIVPSQFKQLFHNLVSNSLKFMRSDRDLVICVRKEIVLGEETLNKKLKRRQEYHHIMYSDNGSGFDPQYNARVFGLFQRLDSKKRAGGTGIGLAICKQIVENHHGIIMADGRLNEGVRFDIYIPIEKKETRMRKVSGLAF